MSRKHEIYLDESGNFEKSSGQGDENHGRSQREVSFIGGVVVPPELKEKEKDLYESMQGILKQFFPGRKKITHIHLNELEGRQKQSCRDKLFNIFREKMQDARIIFIYDLSPLEETPLPGAQYYRNMLLTLLQTTIFYHPSFRRNDHFQVNVAHRRIDYPAAFDKDLAAQGYLKLKEHRGRIQFTAITQAELGTIMGLLQKNTLRFVSKREASYTILPYKDWDSPFMVMADCLCNTFYRDFSHQFDEKKALKSITQEFGSKLLFFCPYEYEIPEGTLSKYFQGKLGAYISQAYMLDLKNPSNTLLIYPGLQKSKKELSQLNQPEECDKLLQVADSLLNQKYFSKISEINELYTIARDNILALSNPPLALKMRAHDVGLRYCNHTGNVKQGCFHRDEGCKIFDQLQARSLEESRNHHNFINRASVVDTNEFAFERAIARLRPIMQAEEDITSVFGPKVQNETVGKIYGSVAQNYAFLQKRKEADEYFQKAAFHLDQPGKPSLQQASYRAHLALDKEEWGNYTKEMCCLLGLESFPGFQKAAPRCLDNLPDSPYDFYIHLILKGMFVFSENEKKGGLAELIFEDIWSRGWFREISEQHPWELVLIALGKILFSVDEHRKAEQCWRAAADFVKDEEKLTLIMLSHLARAWLGLVACMKGEDNQHILHILRPIQLTFQKLAAHDLYPGAFNPNQQKDYDKVIRAGWFDQVGQKFLDSLETADRKTLESLSLQFIKLFTFNYW